MEVKKEVNSLCSWKLKWTKQNIIMKRPLLLLVFSFYLLVSSSLQAQDATYARRVIRNLSSSSMYGRGHSYKGDSIAAAYLAEEFRKIGVQPLAPGYLQRYSYACYSQEGPISLSISGTELKPYEHYRIYPATRHATSKRLKEARWKKQMKDGTWIFSVTQLDTYSPFSGQQLGGQPVACVEVLDSILPKHPRKVELTVPMQYHPTYWTQNVVGYVQGEVDTMMVFTAHYDHCGTMGDGVVFPGAHDNASGVAAVMDLARRSVLSRPHYTMVFMFFSGEESGLKGSKYAAEHPLIDFSKVRLLCNIDMFCGGDEGLMVFNAKSSNTKAFFNRLKALNDKSHVAPEIRPRDNSANSDHYWFTSRCPAIFILTMGGPYGGYHDPADTCEGCGLDHYRDYLNLLIEALGI